MLCYVSLLCCCCPVTPTWSCLTKVVLHRTLHGGSAGLNRRWISRKLLFMGLNRRRIAGRFLCYFWCPNDWTKWKRRFDRYLAVSGLQGKSEELQISSLIYCMGDEAEDILATFELSDEDAKKYETVVTKFKDHFNRKKNIIFERARFNSRKQEEGEPADVFITALHTLFWTL